MILDYVMHFLPRVRLAEVPAYNQRFGVRAYSVSTHCAQFTNVVN